MPDLVTINNTALEVLTYKEQRVVTFAMVAEVHGIAVDNIRRAFQRNKERFVEGQDYFRLDFAEASQLERKVLVSPNGEYVFTEDGYLLLVKPLRDDMSWVVQKRMRDAYFHVQRLVAEASALDAFPELKAIANMALALAEDRQNIVHLQAVNAGILAEQSAQKDTIIANQQQTIEALSTSQRAEGKADLLADAHRMTVQEFVLKNGLLRQFPDTQWSAISRWISGFCNLHNLDFVPIPVVGQRWSDENNYPIQAIMAWLRYEQKRPQQITLVRPPGTGVHHATS